MDDLILSGQTLPEITKDGFNAVVELFLSLQDIKPSSKETYRKSLHKFGSWVESRGKDLARLTRADILEYSEYLLQGDHQDKNDPGRVSVNTTASYLVSLRKFYEFCESEKIYPNIAKSVKTPKRKNKFEKQHLSTNKAKDLLSYFEEKSLRDFAIVNLLLRTGLRTIEAVRANIEDITFKSGESSTQRVLLIQGKGRNSKDDFVILTDASYLPIKRYLETRKGARGGDPLFVSNSRQNYGERLSTQTLSKLCREGLDAIGLDGREFSAHSLRHTTAVTLLKQDTPLFEVQQVLRHSSPATTEIYLESIKEERRLDICAESKLDNLF